MGGGWGGGVGGGGRGVGGGYPNGAEMWYLHLPMLIAHYTKKYKQKPKICRAKRRIKANMPLNIRIQCIYKYTILYADK